jgi:uncharacterized protein (TIRG00374 family)
MYSKTNQEPVAPEHEARESVAERGFSLKERLLSLRTVISFALAFAMILFVFRGIDIDIQAIWRQVQHINLWFFLLAFIVFYLTFPIRALRWRILLCNADFPIQAGRHSWASLRSLTEYLGLSWFANCVVPAKLGDAYRGYLLKHNGNVSFSRSFGTIFAERLLDMVVLFTLLVVAGWSVFGTRLPAGARYAFMLGLVLVMIILFGLVAMRFLSPLIRRVMPGRFHQVYQLFEAGTLGSFKVSTLPGLFVLTTLVWLGESLRLFLVIKAVGGLQLGLPAVVFVALMGSLLTTVPATPGGLGLVEGGIIGILRSSLFSIAGPIAGAIALLDRVISYWSIVVFGFILYLLSKRK